MLRRCQRHEVGLEEVAIVVGVFLGSQRVRATVAFIPVPSLLSNDIATLEQIDLSAGLVLDGPADRPHTVDVLDLAAGAERSTGLVHADIGVDPHAAFLHLGMGCLDRQENAAQFGDVLPGLLGRADVGTADDLDQRNAGTVEVDQRVVAAVNSATGPTEVCALPCVFFEVSALDADAGSVGQREEPIDIQRLVVLTDLICLGHVGIEVVLAVERARPNRAVQCQTDAHRQLDGLAIQHRQCPRKTERDRVDVGVRLVAEAIRTRREQLRHRGQFDVDFEADNQLPIAGETVERAHDTARSSAAAARNICGSPSVPARTCTPTGNPSAPVPNGTLMPGWPVRFAGMVYTSHRYIASGLSPLAPNGNATLGDAGVKRTSAC